jgi:hypothetical protein
MELEVRLGSAQSADQGLAPLGSVADSEKESETLGPAQSPGQNRQRIRRRGGWLILVG